MGWWVRRWRREPGGGRGGRRDGLMRERGRWRPLNEADATREKMGYKTSLTGVGRFDRWTGVATIGPFAPVGGRGV
jgi:hypothetical protein